MGGIYAVGTINFTFEEVMLLGIVLNFAAGFGSFLFGYLEDKIGAKRVINISLIVLIIATFIAYFAPETNFPKEDHTKLTINGKGKFDLKLRVPGWATNGFTVKINGKDQKVKATPGTYLSLSRKWKDGDTVELQMPFGFYLDPIMDQQNIASLFYGPVLLAAQEDEPRTDWRKVNFDAENIGASIKGNPEELTFEIDGVMYKPFYDTYGRHSVYLDVDLD